MATRPKKPSMHKRSGYLLKIKATNQTARTYHDEGHTVEKIVVHLIDGNMRPTGERKVMHPHDITIIGFID